MKVELMSGEVMETQAKHYPYSVTILKAGFGYKLNVTTRTLLEIAEQDTILLYVHEKFDSDKGEYTSFGFSEKEERTILRYMIRADRVGATSAMKILEQMPYNAVALLMTQGDIKGLLMLTGVGKKGAAALALVGKDMLKDAKKGITEL